jgi:hypothetical protein
MGIWILGVNLMDAYKNDKKTEDVSSSTNATKHPQVHPPISTSTSTTHAQSYFDALITPTARRLHSPSPLSRSAAMKSAFCSSVV